jgi:DNA end-binding protein Ku
VGKIQFGNKEHLAALKADGPAIVLNLMHFVEEMEDPKLFKFPPLDTSVGRKELDLAKQLVGTLKGHFHAGEFENTHRTRLEETIRGKVDAGMGVAVEGGGKAGGDRKVIDLMERLKQSLQQGGGKAARAGKGAKTAKAEPETVHAEKHYHRKKAG